MQLPQEAQKMLMEMQTNQQVLQNIANKKERIAVNLKEVESALEGLESASKDVYRIQGPVMIKKDKDNLQKELKEEKEDLEIQEKAVTKKEKELQESMQKSQQELQKYLAQSAAQGQEEQSEDSEENNEE